jgi:hypothetical protein
VKKEPEMEYQECAICEKKFSEHSVEMHKALRADRAGGAAACGADFVVSNEEATGSIPVSSTKP